MNAPSVELLLDVDREYREKAKAGTLRRIVPRHMNPEGKAWLPVRAHKLHRVCDWVVIYYSDPDGDEGQATVVTERRGALTGLRVVRGREPECARHYRLAERSSSLEPSLSASDG